MLWKVYYRECNKEKGVKVIGRKPSKDVKSQVFFVYFIVFFVTIDFTLFQE